ncbi:MAG: universal stress protein [Nitrospirae bacterium]|nr:universal stress protein [Nitrospirota bacterium]
MTNKQVCPTPGFERLLIATDGSEFSKAAINEGIAIAKACSSKLFVVSVVEVNEEYEALAPKIVEKAEKEMREHLEWVKSIASKEGLDCETIIHQGEEPYQYIVDEAAQKEVKMIIMGSHGRTGLKRLMMGSVASRVIGHAPCAVLVVSMKGKK